MADEEDGQDWTSQWAPPRDVPSSPERKPWQADDRPPQWPAPPGPPLPPPPAARVARHRALWPVNKPAGHGLYVTYAVLMALLYVGCTVFGLWLLQTDLDATSTLDPEDVRMRALVFTAIGPPLALLFGIAPFLPKRPWSWVYGLVMIIIGLTSCCTWPLTIPLLLRWFRPEFKAYYRKA